MTLTPKQMAEAIFGPSRESRLFRMHHRNKRRAQVNRLARLYLSGELDYKRVALCCADEESARRLLREVMAEVETMRGEP